MQTHNSDETMLKNVYENIWQSYIERFGFTVIDKWCVNSSAMLFMHFYWLHKYLDVQSIKLYDSVQRNRQGYDVSMNKQLFIISFQSTHQIIQIHRV